MSKSGDSKPGVGGAPMLHLKMFPSTLTSFMA